MPFFGIALVHVYLNIDFLLPLNDKNIQNYSLCKIFNTFAFMKCSIKLFLMLFVVVGIGSAALARTCVSELSTTNDATVIVVDDNQFESQDLFGCSDYPYNGIDLTALLPEPILVPEGNIEFLKEKKPVYKSPAVDKKWVWLNSIISNS